MYELCMVLFDILLCINLVRFYLTFYNHTKIIHNKRSNKIVQSLYTIKCHKNRTRFIHNKMSNKIAQGLYTIKCQIKLHKVYTQ
jgi:RecJ-like exonuclease